MVCYGPSFFCLDILSDCLYTLFVFIIIIIMYFLKYISVSPNWSTQPTTKRRTKNAVKTNFCECS